MSQKTIAKIMRDNAGDDGAVIIPDEVSAIDTSDFINVKKSIVSLYMHKGFLGLKPVAPIGKHFLYDPAISDKAYVYHQGPYKKDQCNGKELFDFITSPRLTVRDEFVVHEDNPIYASFNGMLFSKDLKMLLSCPRSFKGRVVLPEQTQEIVSKAFKGCNMLTELVLAENMHVFYDGPRGYFTARSPKSFKIVGLGVWRIESDGDNWRYHSKPVLNNAILVFPRVILSTVSTYYRPNLALGYCTSPELYSSEQADSYLSFLKENRIQMLSLAMKLRVPAVGVFYGVNLDPAGNTIFPSTSSLVDSAKDPSVAKEKRQGLGKAKRRFKVLSPRAAVALLEEQVCFGTYEDVKDVLNTQKKLVYTSRALGLACRYGGLDKVKLLVESGHNFNYEHVSTLNNHYYGNYVYDYGSNRRGRADFRLLIVVDRFRKGFVGEGKALTLDESDNVARAKLLSETKRIEIIKYLIEMEHISKHDYDTLFFHAILFGNFKIARFMRKLGGTLKPYYRHLCGVRRGWLGKQMRDIFENEHPRALVEFSKIAKSDGIKFNVSIFMDLKMFFADPSLMSEFLTHCNMAPLTFRRMLLFIIADNLFEIMAVVIRSGKIKTGAQIKIYTELAMQYNSREIIAQLLELKRSRQSKKSRLSL